MADSSSEITSVTTVNPAKIKTVSTEIGSTLLPPMASSQLPDNDDQSYAAAVVGRGIVKILPAIASSSSSLETVATEDFSTTTAATQNEEDSGGVSFIGQTTLTYRTVPTPYFQTQAPFDETTETFSSTTDFIENEEGNTTLPPIATLTTLGDIPCDWDGWDILDLCMLVFGTFGNIFALYLMQRRGLRSRSYALSLSVLALFNSLTLLVLGIQAADRLASKHFKFSIEAYIGAIGCKFYRMALPVVQLMSHWVVVFITTERFVAVCFPLWVASIFSVTRSKIILATLFGVVLLSQCWRPYFDTQDPATNTTAASCFSRPFQIFQNIDLFFHQLFMLCLLPAILIFFMNSAVIVQVYRMSREISKSGGRHRGKASRDPRDPLMNEEHRKSLTNRNSGNALASDDSSARNRKTTVLLLAVSCSFLLYICPYLGLLLYIRILHLAEGIRAAMVEFVYICTVIKAAHLLTVFSYADNFFVFIMAGENFRRELRYMMLKAAAFCFPRVFSKRFKEEAQRLSASGRHSSRHGAHSVVHNKAVTTTDKSSNSCKRSNTINSGSLRSRELPARSTSLRVDLTTTTSSLSLSGSQQNTRSRQDNVKEPLIEIEEAPKPCRRITRIRSSNDSSDVEELSMNDDLSVHNNQKVTEDVEQRSYYDNNETGFLSLTNDLKEPDTESARIRMNLLAISSTQDNHNDSAAD